MFRPAFNKVFSSVFASVFSNDSTPVWFFGKDNFDNFEFESITPANGTYEMLGVKVGTGDVTSTHAGTMYALDYLGAAQSFAADEPVYEGARHSGGNVYADDGAGNLLDPQPMLVSDGFSDAAQTIPAVSVNTFSGANHSNTKGPYLLEAEFTGADQDVLKIGSDVMLAVEDGLVDGNTVKVLTLSDQTNEVSLPLMGEEQVEDSGFDDPLSWTTAGSWEVAGGAASCDGTQISTENITHDTSSAYSLGDLYQITIEVEGHTGGTVGPNIVAFGSAIYFNSDGVHSVIREVIAAGEYEDRLRANSAFAGSVTSLSVKPLTATGKDHKIGVAFSDELGANIVPDSGFDDAGAWIGTATIANSAATFNSVGEYLYQYPILDTVPHKVTIVCSSNDDGGIFQVRLSADSGYTVVGAGVGEFEVEITPLATNQRFQVFCNNFTTNPVVLESFEVKPIIRTMALNVDNVWSDDTDYDGSFGSGDIELGATSRELKRGQSELLTVQKSIVDGEMS